MKYEKDDKVNSDIKKWLKKDLLTLEKASVSVNLDKEISKRVSKK